MWFAVSFPVLRKASIYDLPERTARNRGRGCARGRGCGCGCGGGGSGRLCSALAYRRRPETTCIYFATHVGNDCFSQRGKAKGRTQTRGIPLRKQCRRNGVTQPAFFVLNEFGFYSGSLEYFISGQIPPPSQPSNRRSNQICRSS